jgi:L-lactate dehydrogenase complex protein LldG
VEGGENSGRERILARIRSAMGTPAPKHASSSASAAIFSPVTDMLGRFQRECAENITECVLTAGVGASGDALRAVLESIPPGEIYVQDAPLLRRMVPRAVRDRTIRWSTEGPPNEPSQATVTGAEYLIAATGSVLVASSGGGRGASVVAPVHIVVAGQSQLQPDLESAFAHANQRGLPARNSCLCLITGSSRTADIEKILVLGAHGPRRLVVLLAERLD